VRGFARAIDDILNDLRYASRVLRHSPSFAAVAVLSLALGIGANTAIFTFVNAVLLKSLPVRQPHQLVMPAEWNDGRQVMVWSRTDSAAFRAAPSLAGLCAFRPSPMRVATPAGPESVSGQLVWGDCPSVLGIAPSAGRLLTSQDEGRPVVVIGHAFWMRVFNGDPGAIGRTLDVQGHLATIVGVTPPAFSALEAGRRVDVTVPMAAPFLDASSRLMTVPTARWIRLIARLAPGTTRDQAEADLQRILAKTRTTSAPVHVELLSGAQGVNDLRREYATPLRILMLGVGVLLLLACLNLGSLLLARSRARDRELGLRLALGATRGRVVRQLLAEALLLSSIGGASGLLFARWAVEGIVAMLSRGRSAIFLDLTPDARVLAFAMAVSVAAGLILGALPALLLRGSSLRARMDRPARSAQRVQRALPIAAQAALSIVLVIGAGLFLRSLTRLQQVDAGFARQGVLLAGAPGDRRTHADLLARLERLPSVRSATLTMDTPLNAMSWFSGLALRGADGQSQAAQVNFNFVGPRFFETLGIPLVDGRDFRADDDADAPLTAVVNQAFARRYFSGRRALGEVLTIGSSRVEIVGVAADARYLGFRKDAPDIVYRPSLQQPNGYGLTVAIRAALPESVMAPLVRQELRAMAPDAPVPGIDSLAAQIDASIATERLLAVLSGFMGVMAMLLVGVGVYGAIAYGAARRRREVGVRLALGAAPRDVTRLMMREVLLPVMLGLAAGLPVALAASRVARALLFETGSSDPATYLLSVGLIVAVAAAAAWIPSRRAGAADPMAALRAD
jgi:predicted permease